MEHLTQIYKHIMKVNQKISKVDQWWNMTCWYMLYSNVFCSKMFECFKMLQGCGASWHPTEGCTCLPRTWEFDEDNRKLHKLHNRNISRNDIWSSMKQWNEAFTSHDSESMNVKEYEIMSCSAATAFRTTPNQTPFGIDQGILAQLRGCKNMKIEAKKYSNGKPEP